MKICEKHHTRSANGEHCASCRTERRALYRDAYMAALGGYCANPVRHHCGGEAYEIDPDIEAHKAALETVRRWDAMIAELEEG